ncbi:MAG: hypothetical protein LBH60_05515, partial [Prevotellaceae bacterium]|nr:hypothetical protein [Prevotellaceae bacterium]
NFILTVWGDNSEKTKISLYSKKEKKTTLSFGTKYGEKVISGNDIHFNRPDQMLIAIYSHYADSHIKSKYVSEEQKSMLRSMFGETEDDNPVLEVIYLKK